MCAHLYDQVSYYDPATSTWKHFVNDADFNDFDTFEYGRTYEVHILTTGGVSFSISGESPGTDLQMTVKEGENFVSPPVTTGTAVTTVLSGLTYQTDYDDVRYYDAVTDTWKKYSTSDFTNFEKGKGYIIDGSTGVDTTFSYGKNEKKTTFVYDSTGARTKKAVVGGSTTVYLGKDYDKVGSDTTKYIFLGDRRIATRKNSDGAEFTHTDHINSSNIITDSSGNQSGMLEYSPYGSTATHTGTADPKHKYTGQEEDPDSDLYYYGARYYDPELGRFITADPYIQDVKDPQAFNRYAYARNNPIIFTDPTGNFFIELFVAIAAIVKAVADAAVAFGVAYGALGTAIGSATGLTGLAATAVGHAILGAAVGATLGTLDAAVNGRSVGQGAAYGAIGGAISGGVVGPAGGVLGEIAGKMGMGVAVGIARVGVGSYLTFSAIKNENYFSAAFAAINTLATATIVADQIHTTIVGESTPDQIMGNKQMKSEFDRAWQDSDVYNDDKRHEEGGWIRKKLFGRLDVERWPSGQQAGISPTPQPRNAIYHFHTHPNYGGNWELGPSSADIRFSKHNEISGFVVNKEAYVYYDGGGEQNKWPRQ